MTTPTTITSHAKNRRIFRSSKMTDYSSSTSKKVSYSTSTKPENSPLEAHLLNLKAGSPLWMQPESPI